MSTEGPKEGSRPVGRPTSYTIEKAAEICAQLAAGKSLVAICRDDGMPDAATVYRWIAAHDEFREMYTRAREDQADTLADETLEIADDGRNDWMLRNGEDDNGWVANGENIQRSRLRVDTRKWIASKLKPKKYGEKLSQEVSGPNGERLIPAGQTVAAAVAAAAAIAAAKDPVEAARQYQDLMAGG